MITDLWLIGIGTGNPAHITLEGQAALRGAAAVLVPHKGAGKEDLADLRHAILDAAGTAARIIPFEYPVRDPALPYLERVNAWHDQIARRWQDALTGADITGPVALLVWGDPALYDSTLRIAARLSPRPALRVIPGITAIQALTAAHAIPLNDLNQPVTVTTGRRLRDVGWPAGSDTLVVMLDGECSFAGLAPEGLHIWWGAYLGGADQVLVAGPVAQVTQQIIDTRRAARARHGWIMDTYLLRRG